jgi:hypothetical protein
MHWIVVSRESERAVFSADDASTDGFENQPLFALAGWPRLLAAIDAMLEPNPQERIRLLRISC